MDYIRQEEPPSIDVVSDEQIQPEDEQNQLSPSEYVGEGMNDDIGEPIDQSNGIDYSIDIDEINGMDDSVDIKVDENPIVTIEEYVKHFEEMYSAIIPTSWGERVDGVITEIDTQDKVIALTFDACGGRSDGYDEKIVDFLIREEIPATLFINSKWIDKYPDQFANLAANSLFEIANHGYQHRPLSVMGESAYGIAGTQNIKEVVEEILLNDEKILKITGQRPVYFRSGTAYYDEVAVKIANELGYEVVNYNVLGDAGATFSKEQIVKACLSSAPGSIILFHMNRPETNIAEGIIEGITQLRDKGYAFAKLSDYHDLLK